MPRHTKEYLEESRMEKSERRFTVKGMIQDEFYNLIHMERRKFFYTAWDLSVRPAKAIGMLLNGHRKYLYPYLSYLILIGTITIFLSVRYNFFVTGYDLSDVDNFLTRFLESQGFDKAFRREFFYYAEEFATIVNLVAIPVFTLSSYLLFYRAKHNLAEHFILNVYIGAQQLLFLWITIPFLEIMPQFKDTIIAIYTGLTIVYNIWVYITFFKGNIWLNLIKAMVAITLAFIVQTPANYFTFYLLQPFLKWLDPIF